jgi:hypothetical protein
MAHRNFKVTLPADTNFHNLYSLLVGSKYGVANGGTSETGITGAIPTDGILPDRVSKLEIQADIANTGTLTVGDRNSANTSGKVLTTGNTMLSTSMRNTICLKDYLLQGSVASQACEVEIEFI